MLFDVVSSECVFPCPIFPVAGGDSGGDGRFRGDSVSLRQGVVLGARDLRSSSISALIWPLWDSISFLWDAASPATAFNNASMLFDAVPSACVPPCSIIPVANGDSGIGGRSGVCVSSGVGLVVVCFPFAFLGGAMSLGVCHASVGWIYRIKRRKWYQTKVRNQQINMLIFPFLAMQSKLKIMEETSGP